MTDLDLVGLRKIAEAADEVYDERDDHPAVWEYNSVMHPGTVLALLDRIEEQKAELPEFREREAEAVYEYGIRYGDDKSIRRFMSREKAVYHLDAEFGDKLIRRTGARRIVAGEWEEVENE